VAEVFSSRQEALNWIGINRMLCKLCGSENLRKFGEEIAIHFPGRKTLMRRMFL